MKLHPFQIQALKFLENKECHLACATPTGSGKGVILENFAQKSEEKTLLIVPLIALARQFAERFRAKGISVRQDLGEASDLGKASMKYQVWMISPERIASPRVQAQVLAWRPTLIAVDECHCIWEWGTDFRPEYGKVIPWILSQNFSRTLWLSATLSRSSHNELKKYFPSLVTLGEFGLPENLTFSIEKTRWQDRIPRLLRWIDQNRGKSGIIFCQSRKLCESLYRVLLPYYDVVFYHAGLSKEERLGVEARLLSSAGMKTWVIATSAFGLGMDFPDLEVACLFQPPPNLLGLIQAMGRVGRTRPGNAILFYHEEDRKILEQTFPSLAARNPTELQILFRFLQARPEERTKTLKSYFV